MSISDERGTESFSQLDRSADNRAWRQRLRILLAAALLLRILAAFGVDYYVSNAGRAFLIEGDANGYWELAIHICAGEDYAIYTPPRHVLRVPGFPLLLSGSICLFGNSVLAARLVLAVVGTGCCLLTYWLGEQVCSARTGFWAAAFVALNPIHVGNSILILSETWFAFWMLLSLLTLHRLLCSVANRHCGGGTFAEIGNRRELLNSFLTGILIGATVLVRPGYLPWLAVAMFGVLFLSRQKNWLNLQWISRMCVCVVMATGCLTVMLPWAARNANVTGHWIFTSLWSGPSMYDGLNPLADGSSNMQFFEDDNILASMSEFEMNEYYKRKAIEYAKAHPGRAVSLAVSKVGRYLSPLPNLIKTEGWVVGVVCVVLWVGLFGGVLVGLARCWMDYGGILVTMGPLMLFLLVHMVFVGSVRYRLPLEFPLSVLAAIGWQYVTLRNRTFVNGGHQPPPLIQR